MNQEICKLEAMKNFAVAEAIKTKIAQLKLLILDVDGVLTDGKLVFDAAGNEYKTFHARDGHGIKLLQQAGVQVAVISGRKSGTVARRLESLGITSIYQGFENKLVALQDMQSQLGLSLAQMAHMGDDVLDLPVMTRVGVAFAVQDAHFLVQQYADWRTQALGGQGAVREICDLIMLIQGSFDGVMAQYLA